MITNLISAESVVLMNAERLYQEKKWGKQTHHTIGEWATILEHLAGRVRERYTTRPGVTLAYLELVQLATTAQVALSQHAGVLLTTIQASGPFAPKGLTEILHSARWPCYLSQFSPMKTQETLNTAQPPMDTREAHWRPEGVPEPALRVPWRPDQVPDAAAKGEELGVLTDKVTEDCRATVKLIDRQKLIAARNFLDSLLK